MTLGSDIVPDNILSASYLTQQFHDQDVICARMSNECTTESACTQGSAPVFPQKGRTGRIIASKPQSQESEDEVAARRQDHVIANAYQDG